MAHNFKAGVNWVHEPHLFISTTSGVTGFYTMAANDVNGPVQQVQVHRRRIAGQHPAGLLLRVPAGRLAGDEPADVQSRRALGLRHQHAAQPGQQPELPGDAGRGRSRPLRGNAARGFREVSPRRTRTTFSRASGSRTTCAATARDVVRGGGASIRISRTPTRTR